MSKSRSSLKSLPIAACLCLALPAGAPCADQIPERIEPFLEAHCFDCHDDETTKGDLNLYELEFAPEHPANFRLWERVYDRVESGEMPPKKKTRPGAKAKEAFLDTISAPLLEADRKDRASRGRVHVRRLTRREYEHTVHDLLGIDIPLQELLPEDPATHGFETVADGQQLSHFNLAYYLEAADLALDEAFGRSVEGEEKFSKKIPPLKLGKAGAGRGNFRGPETPSKNLAIAWPLRLQFYGRMPATKVPESGWYRITLKNVHSINQKAGAAWGTLRSGACASNEPILYPVGIVEATKERRDMVYEAWIRQGHMLELKPNDATRKTARSGKGGNVSYAGRNLRKEGYEGIGLEGIHIERVYPNAARWELRKRLLGNLPQEEAFKLMEANTKPPGLLRKTIHQFAERAFRRPVTDEQIAPYVKLALAEIDRPGERPADGLRAAYRAILCSPRFLTLIEKPGILDDHALASRMSYMFWNSMPDNELRSLADSGKLADYKVRHAQVERMLADPKATRFIASFTDQWLTLKDIDFTSPDQRLYRSFDTVVKESMLAETRAFVKDLIDNNASITNVIHSDFTMLNERLARYYGMGDLPVKPGAGLQRIRLGDKHPRGGLVTHGSVLKVTANGTTTSPVVRGVWVSERLLGVEIPPPPPGVAAVEPDVRGAVSIREQLAKHNNTASCAACHDKIDPPGFALEAYDPVGLWRAKYGNRKTSAQIDPSGTTPDGEKFANLIQWKRIYVKRPEMLTEAFAKHLITYATGAAPRFSDRRDIAKIVALARVQNYGMKRIIHAVVASETFRHK